MCVQAVVYHVATCVSGVHRRRGSAAISSRWLKYVTIYITIKYEHVLEQVHLAEQLTSSDFGVSTG